MAVDEQLLRSPIFDSLSDEDLQDIQNYVETIHLDGDEILFEKGETGEVIYTILEGLIKISLPDASSGREKTIALLSEGEILGEMATLGNQDRSAQARAIRESDLIKIAEDDFRTLLNKFPDIGMNVIRILSRRLLMSDEEIQTVTFQTIPGRLAAQLLKLADQFGVETDDGTKIDIKLTHRLLADLVGTNRETITRYLNNFEEEGSILKQDQSITIQDHETLEHWM
jgi:CRP-like cAMP-binding protein